MEVKIAIYSRTQKSTDGRKFTTYSTKYAFRNEDGTRTKRYIQVKFSKDAFDGSNLSLKDIKRGYLRVDGQMVGCPDKYEIIVDPKTMKKTYPVCWIRGGIKGYEELLKEHTFHFDSDLESEETANDTEIGDLEPQNDEVE